MFFLQLTEERTQTRGTWWRLDKHRWGRTLIPNLRSLKSSKSDKLLKTFEELRDLEFPSLLDQLKTSFEGRRKLDKVWLSVLGIPEEKHDKLLTGLHQHLYETLNLLLQAMSND